MATLKTVMSNDVDDVFLDTDEHGESVTLYKFGDLDQAVSLTANVDEAHLEGSREVEGDGVYPYRENNVVRESIVIGVPAATAVQDPQGRRPDVFVWDSKQWTAMRVMGRDGGMKDVLCALTQREWTQQPKRM